MILVYRSSVVHVHVNYSQAISKKTDIFLYGYFGLVIRSLAIHKTFWSLIHANGEGNLDDNYVTFYKRYYCDISMS